MDRYQSLRELPPLEVLSALGVDTSKFKKRSGKAEWYAGCPVHNSKNNQTCFSINADGKFNCFSCQAKGRGAIDLVRAVRACGFQEAIAFLESIAGRTVQTPAPAAKAVPEGNSEATEGILRPLEKDTWRKFQVPCEWLEKRVPDAAIREHYGVFCYNNPARRSAYSGRVMIPVKNEKGVLFGYLGRHILGTTGQQSDGQDIPKYLFPKNLPRSRFLFGAYELKSGIWREATPSLPVRVLYLVESPFCVLKFAMYGLPAVAAYGWSVSDDQISLLGTICKGLVYLPDRNKSEEAAAQCAHIARSLWVRFPPLPDGVDDPEHLTKEQILAL